MRIGLTSVATVIAVIGFTGAGMAQMKGEGVLIHYRSAFKFWRKHRGGLGGMLVRVIAVFHALAWSLACLVKSLLFQRTWRESGNRLALYGKIILLALGMIS